MGSLTRHFTLRVCLKQNGTMVSLNSFLDSLNSAQVSLNIIDWTVVSSR